MPPLATVIMWTYDGAGRVLGRTANGATTSYTYDDNGNRLTATAATGTITATYDRLNRVLTVDDEDAGSGVDTSYTYSLTNPSWTDPTGSYTVSLDKFDRQTALTDPIHGASTFTWSYRADGQRASQGAPNGNTTTFGYDDAGAPLSRLTEDGPGTDRANYAWTRNRAGQIVTEASTITGDPTNGTTTYGYDPLERLISFSRAGSTTSYAWQEVPNRSSVQVGANPAVTTSFDDANRPTSDSAGGSYAHDLDGRMTASPGQQFEWDSLSRLTRVKDAPGTSTLATYTYDALDRLLLADYGGSNRIRFRYLGLTTAVAQTIDDVTSSVIRHVGNDWTGGRLVDWTGAGSNQRFHGTNGHHDVTWTADSSGVVSATLRYDPWGNLIQSSGASLPDFRFQGSLYDVSTDLSWLVTRWYSPTLGRFVSEDTLLGNPVDPPSRHLYAYGEGDPIANWDPTGASSLSWCVICVKVAAELVKKLLSGGSKATKWVASKVRSGGGGITKIAVINFLLRFRPACVGETASRVQLFSGFGTWCEIYREKAATAKRALPVRYAANAAWLGSMMLRIKVVIDLGLDPLRNDKRGPFYKLEHNILTVTNYPLRLKLPGASYHVGLQTLPLK